MPDGRDESEAGDLRGCEKEEPSAKELPCFYSNSTKESSVISLVNAALDFDRKCLTLPQMVESKMYEDADLLDCVGYISESLVDGLCLVCNISELNDFSEDSTTGRLQPESLLALLALNYTGIINFSQHDSHLALYYIGIIKTFPKFKAIEGLLNSPRFVDIPTNPHVFISRDYTSR